MVRYGHVIVPCPFAERLPCLPQIRCSPVPGTSSLRLLEHVSHTTPPQPRQWCGRVKKPNSASHWKQFGASSFPT